MRESPETGMEFPCEFPIKAMGRAGPHFDATVVDIIRRHVTDLKEGAVTSRQSRNGNYISVTITIRATSRDQLDAIYQDLSTCAQVLVAL